MGRHAVEYFQAVKIRDDAISTVEGMAGNFLMGKRERENYAAQDYMRRLEIIEDAAWETDGVLVECKEVRMTGISSQTLLKVQTLTNAAQKLLDGKIERHRACPDRGSGANLEMLYGTGYGKLLINTEMYPCVKRAFVSLGAIRVGRI